MKTPLAAVLACSVLGVQIAAQEAPGVRTSVDRTAVWVGDRVTYTVEFVRRGDTDVLLDDLSADRLPVRGGEVLSMETSEESTAEGTIRRVRYLLTTYSVEAPEIEIDNFRVRYFSRRTIGSAAQGAPLGEVVVPSRGIAIRSTLPAGGRMPEVRAPADLRQASRYAEVLRPAAWILVTIAIVPVGFVLLDVAGRLRRTRAGRHRRGGRRRRQALLADLATLRPASDQERTQAFEQLDRLVREHIESTSGVPAPALTPAELTEALERRRASIPVEELEALLRTCERARYAPHPVSDADWRQALASAETLIARR